jgi:hypothetical protein
MTDTAKSNKRASQEGSQSPISHSICGILGLGNEPGRECLAEKEIDAPQVADQDQQSETTEENPESIEKQGKHNFVTSCVSSSQKLTQKYNRSILNRLKIKV